MIDSTSSSASSSGPNPVPPESLKAAYTPLRLGRDRLSTENADRLRSALANDPEIRPDVIERGQALAADHSYPPAGVVQQVATQILNAPDLSEDQS